MSVHDRAAAAIVTQLALSADGALLGIGLAYVAFRAIQKFSYTSSAIRKIQSSPLVQPSDLRSLLSSDESSLRGSEANSCRNDEIIVIVRGTVEVQSAVKGPRSNSRNNSDVIVSHESGETGVILERNQMYIYNEWRGVLGWTYDLRSLISRSWRATELTAVKSVPFVLVESGKKPQSDYINVNMEGSKHPLPLTTVYRHALPIAPSPNTFLQAIFGHEFPIGILDEEKLLPLGKEIHIIGSCMLKDGVPEIKSCKDLPYFLSELDKDQMVSALSHNTKVLMWSGIVFGSLAVVVLGYAIGRNWIKWKEWRQRRQSRRQIDDSSNNDVSPSIAAVDEESGDVPDGELCVICLMRRRRSAFIPCGHLVCCQRCALSVEREASPKCPVCRQSIRNSVRIYDS